ncbi:MAG: PAS domain S-box protein [Frankiaceae bacterium]|nr:PAS domain S-box protein [Frankiaceae bacterium]
MSSISAGTDPRPGAVLRLPPTARSAGEARRFLRALLEQAGRAGWVDGAELALSEVVTNGVLHAHTDLVVRVHLSDHEVEVEVQDANPVLPVQRGSADVEATTGRGLDLVAALTRDCGVRAEPGGKVVWFTVGDSPAADLDEHDLLAAWDIDGWDADPTPETITEMSTEVVLRGLPPTLWLAVREHHQALLRELVLYLAEHGPGAASAPDLPAADEARALVWTALTAVVDRAREQGTARSPLPPGHPASLPEVPETVDLVLHVPQRLGAAFGALQDALDLGERLALLDLLLVRPGLPEVVAVRAWACEQVVAQLAGVPAAPWAGADQEHFTDLVHDRADPELPQWDASVVIGSDRGVVAADDANRIIAISEPLARTTGWDPADLVGRRVVALIPPALREAHVAGFTRHLSTGQAHVLGVALELPVLCRDGSEVLCHFLVERADVSNGRPVYLAWISPIEG